MKKVSLSATLRTGAGTSNSNTLRRQGRVPCVLYGSSKATHFHVDAKALGKVVFTPETYRIELEMDGTPTMALLKETQFHPVTDAPIHVDFMELNDSKEATVALSLKLNGQPVGVRKGGVLSQKFRKVRVKGLPSALPEHLDLDVTAVELGESVRMSDLKFPGLTVAERGTDVVLTLKMPKKVEEVVVAAVATTAAPAAGAATPAAAGAAAPAAADAKKADGAKPAGKK
ncbi:MAG: 50S ribosomal protein L25 [Flavobacteriales bacterium]